MHEIGIHHPENSEMINIKKKSYYNNFPKRLMKELVTSLLNNRTMHIKQF